MAGLRKNRARGHPQQPRGLAPRMPCRVCAKGPALSVSYAGVEGRTMKVARRKALSAQGPLPGQG